MQRNSGKCIGIDLCGEKLMGRADIAIVNLRLNVCVRRGIANLTGVGTGFWHFWQSGFLIGHDYCPVVSL
jgi:hypothetical protein